MAEQDKAMKVSEVIQSSVDLILIDPDRDVAIGSLYALLGDVFSGLAAGVGAGSEQVFTMKLELIKTCIKECPKEILAGFGSMFLEIKRFFDSIIKYASENENSFAETKAKLYELLEFMATMTEEYEIIENINKDIATVMGISLKVVDHVLEVNDQPEGSV